MTRTFVFLLLNSTQNLRLLDLCSISFHCIAQDINWGENHDIPCLKEGSSLDIHLHPQPIPPNPAPLVLGRLLNSLI